MVIQWYLRSGSTEVRVRYWHVQNSLPVWELAIKRKTNDALTRQESEYIIVPSNVLLDVLKDKPCSAKIRKRVKFNSVELALDYIYDFSTMTPIIRLAELELLDDIVNDVDKAFNEAKHVVERLGITLYDIPIDKQDSYKNSKLARVYNLSPLDIISKFEQLI